jgi:hypothetical protein
VAELKQLLVQKAQAQKIQESRQHQESLQTLLQRCQRKSVLMSVLV